jgi:glycosyltransferase involved in cell wall biosynthesis
MKVVHAHRIASIGGSERHLLTLLPALAARGLDVSFVGLDVPGQGPEAFYRELERLRVPFDRLPSPRDLSPRTGALLRRVVGRRRPDLLHTHLVHADAYGALVGGRTIVSTKHNDDPFRAGPFRLVERMVTHRAARVICITEALARFNRDVVGLPAAKLRVVHYGMDAPPAPWGSDPVPVPIPPGARIVLCVGRLVPQKGLDVVLRALPSIRAAEPRAVLVILGEGPEREALELLGQELGIADALRLPGHVGDVSAWLQRAELFVHPARWEGFGLVLLEAMLAGKAIVASRVSAVPEIVIDGVTGLLVPPDDPAALAHGVGELLVDPARAAGLGAAGRDRARSSFSVDRMVEETLAVYEEALG